MAPAGPKVTEHRVDHNRTTPSKEDRICYLNWVTLTRGGVNYNWWVLEVGGMCTQWKLWGLQWLNCFLAEKLPSLLQKDQCFFVLMGRYLGRARLRRVRMRYRFIQRRRERLNWTGSILAT